VAVLALKSLTMWSTGRQLRCAPLPPITTGVMCKGGEVFHQYDVVRIIALYEQFRGPTVWLGSEAPTVGDEATIIDVHEKPSLAYDLESVALDGSTKWAATFKSGDADLELVSKIT